MRRIHSIYYGLALSTLLIISGCRLSQESYYQYRGGIRNTPQVVGLPVNPGGDQFWEYPPKPVRNQGRVFHYRVKGATPDQVVEFYTKSLPEWDQEKKKKINTTYVGDPDQTMQLRQVIFKLPGDANKTKDYKVNWFKLIVMRSRSMDYSKVDLYAKYIEGPKQNTSKEEPLKTRPG